MKTKRGICLFAVVSLQVMLLGVQTSRAAIENFDGYSGSLFGQNGGSTGGGVAWTGTWGDQGFASSANVIQGALGSVNGFGSSLPYVEYPLNNSQGGINVLESTRSFTSQSGQAAIYVYALISAGKSGGFNTSSSFGGIGLFGSGTEKFLIGERFGSANWGVASANLNGASQDSLSAIGNFSTTLLLAKIDQQANSLTFYVNPNFSQTEAANTASFTISYGTGNDAIDTVRLRGGNANTGDTWQFDNLNISQLSPFTPVPEPANVALAIFAGVAVTVGLARRARGWLSGRLAAA